MKRGLSLRLRLLTLIMIMAMGFNLCSMPISSISNELFKPPDYVEEGGAPPEGESEELDTAEKQYIPLEQADIPNAWNNPHLIEVFSKDYPVHNDSSFEEFFEEHRIINDYGVYDIKSDKVSPYYTASITPWFSYLELSEGVEVESKLPYREGRGNMLHSELTVRNGRIAVDMPLDTYGNYKCVFGDYTSKTYNINKDQVYLRIGATLLSGEGEIIFCETTWNERSGYRIKNSATDGNAKHIYVDVPLNKVQRNSRIIFESQKDSENEGDSVMTDFYITLIDNTLPAVQSITTRIEEKEDKTADMVLEMEFNEGLRFTYFGGNDADECWIEVELLDLVSRANARVRLYLESLDSTGKITFRGKLGYYHYKNFRIVRISEASMAKKYRSHQRDMVDLADEYYVSAYEKVRYGNSLACIVNEYEWGFSDFYYTTAISDYAGNPINADSIVNWSFGDQTYITNAFEATEIRLFSDVTLAKTQLVSGTEGKTEAELTDQFVGPSRTLTAYLYLDTMLTDEEIKTLRLTFNIQKPDGSYLEAYPTSWCVEETDEVYSNGINRRNLVRFENIRLYEGMRIVNPDGEGSSSEVRILDINDGIEDKEIFALFPKPVTDIYADFAIPVITLEKYAAYSNTEGEAEGELPNYRISLAIGIKDDDSLDRIANILGTKAHVKLGGGVERDTAVRYLLTTDPTAPQSLNEYPNSGYISQDGMLHVGSYTLLNDYTEYYLHLCFETDDIYLDGLKVSVVAEDAVGNTTERQEPIGVDYLIDEIPPTARIEYRRAEAIDGNTKINASFGVSVKDANDVTQIFYSWSENPDEQSDMLPDSEVVKWQTAVFDRSNDVIVEITRSFGDESAASNKIYNDILWVKAVDEFSNESEPIAIFVSLSLEKPQTDVKFEGDINAVSSSHSLIVTGPAASLFGGSDAYTRVTVTPVDDSEYSYVTLVKTGSSVNPLAFEGLEWYKVKRSGDSYTYVSDPERIGSDYTLSEDSVTYPLFTYYGEIKISFENGYGNMTPELGYVYANAAAGSYFEDPNYLLLRYASPYDTERSVYSVDFGAIIDRDDKVVVANADKGSAPYRFNASLRGVNPMRNAQIHFSIANILKSEYGLLDFDYEGSFAELYRVGENGEPDILISRRNGLAATQNQYFIINSVDDFGNYFVSGAYYLKVTVKSKNLGVSVYESSRLVLDAETADDSGVWKYSHQSMASVTAIMEGRYTWEDHVAENAPFESLGVALSVGGETSRNRIFASYSYGSSGLSIILKAPSAQKSYEGISIGGIEGFKVWNILSNPTDGEISSMGFKKDRSGEYLSLINGLEDIYTAETIPKGVNGINNFYLVKGANVFCYQIKLDNGYVSPIRQFTVFVTDYMPELNIAIENYEPSHNPSQIEGMINVDHIRFFIESAYSLNGSGKVDIEVLSDYEIRVGLGNGEDFDELLIPDPSLNIDGEIAPLELPDGRSFKVGDYVDITEDSYTAHFPRNRTLCSAAFYVRDEYGGITIVAPQIGEVRRLENSGSTAYYDEYNIDYMGSYYGDPFVVGDSPTSWRKEYNRIEYFGAQIKSLKNYLIKNEADGEIDYEMISDNSVSLEYNLFNIETNDIEWTYPTSSMTGDRRTYSHNYSNGGNFDLIYWDSATITISGGFLEEGESRELPFSGGENDVGYMGARVYENGQRLVLSFASPRAGNGHAAGEEITWDYTIRCANRYGEEFEYSRSIRLVYINYTHSVSMEKYGAELTLSFESVEYSNDIRTGIFESVENQSITVTDYFGNSIEIVYDVQSAFDEGTEISFSTVDATAGEVIIDIYREGAELTVNVTDYAIMKVEMSDGNSRARITVTANTDFSYGYMDGENERKLTLSVDNIRTPAPIVLWEQDPNQYIEGENGENFRYGEITVYLSDPSFTLRDRHTGKQPSFTFIPGGDKLYTFKKEDIVALFGDKEVGISEDITVSLEIELYPIPDPLGLGLEDTETPSVQILAYTNKDGAYSETKLALQLESTRRASLLNDYKNYKIFDFVGERANASEMLGYIGWSESYRFEIETVDASRVRIFIKEGLYALPPDYETGVSDSIDGVELNSKLLTVRRNAKFTVFVVDAKNNASSIAFDIQNVGSAPIPEIVKVAMGGELIRGYIIPPSGATDFEIVGTLGVGVESDAASEYYGRHYVDYKANDTYIVNYKMTYNGKEVSGAIDVSIFEIVFKELALVGDGVEWSANKASEATAQDITAIATFNDEISEIKIASTYDEDAVSFLVSGSVLTVSYSDNHPAIEIRCLASNGTSVTVRLDEVSNIDKTAPEILVVGRELSENGRSLLLTLTSNERALFKEGGYIGELRENENGEKLYYYERVIVENGVYSYSFIDMSGLVSTVEVEISEIINTPLEAEFSLSLDGSNSVDDPSELEVMVGDKVYVKANRDALAELSDGSSVELLAGAWTEITVSQVLGGIHPYLIITDEYGNILTHQFSKINVPDTVAPDIIVNKKTYSVRVGTPRSQIEAELLANFSAYDDMGDEVTLSVSFTDKLDVIGISEVKYSATDASGNTATVKEKLRITSIYEPVVYYGDKKIDRDEGVIVSADEELRLGVDCSGVAYKVIFKAGIKTEAQMKRDSTLVKDYSKDDTVSFGVLKKGIYTVCIITQERDYFTIRISVE